MFRPARTTTRLQISGRAGAKALLVLPVKRLLVVVVYVRPGPTAETLAVTHIRHPGRPSIENRT